jgi:uncharacterized protein with FMN-binding domain
VRRVILALLSTVTGLVMLLSFKTQQAPTATPLATGTGSTGSTGSSGSAGDASGSDGSIGSATTSGGSQTVTGDEAQTRYGPVQVQITVSDGQITDVETVEYPDGTPRDAEINQFAIPQLNQETLDANSAEIDMVSGATYTSDGYITSLQSALDKAGLG